MLKPYKNTCALVSNELYAQNPGLPMDELLTKAHSGLDDVEALVRAHHPNPLISNELVPVASTAASGESAAVQLKCNYAGRSQSHLHEMHRPRHVRAPRLHRTPSATASPPTGGASHAGVVSVQDPEDREAFVLSRSLSRTTAATMRRPPAVCRSVRRSPRRT